MQRLKDAFIPTVFFSNLMLFLIVTLYRYFMPKNQRKTARNSQRLFSLPHILGICLYLGFISFCVSQFLAHDLQYYRVLNIGRDFKPGQVSKANRKILRKLHPDSSGGDQIKYMIQNETVEAFKKMPKSLLRIYNMFNEDVYMLFSEHSPEVTFDNFHSKRENDCLMLHGFALLLTLFVIKFARIVSQKVKFSVLLSFLLSFYLEAVFFNYFKSFGEYQTLMIEWISGQEMFAQSTFYEVFFALKIAIFFLQQLGVVIGMPMVVEKPMLILANLGDLEEKIENPLWQKGWLNKTEGRPCNVRSSIQEGKRRVIRIDEDGGG